MPRERIKSAITEFLADEMFFDFESGQDSGSTDLFESGRVDSLGFIRLLSFIELTFDVNFDISTLRPEDFRTVDVITETIVSRMTEQSAA